MSEPLTKETLLKYLESGLALDTADVNETTALFSSSLLDSLAMVELIAFVEGAANVRFQPHDVTLDNLDSIERILGFVHQKG